VTVQVATNEGWWVELGGGDDDQPDIRGLVTA